MVAKAPPQPRTIRTRQPRLRPWTGALPLFLFLGLPGFPSDGFAQDAEVEEEIKSILVDMWAAIEEEDLERYARHLHPDFTSFGETDLYLNEGKEYELRAYADYLRRVDGVHTEMHQPAVTVRGDVAWITYYWTDAGIRTGGERFTSRGKSTRIFVREGGRWLCIHGHYTLAGT